LITSRDVMTARDVRKARKNKRNCNECEFVNTHSLLQMLVCMKLSAQFNNNNSSNNSTTSTTADDLQPYDLLMIIIMSFN
jgi:hypothetical protein